MEKHVTRYHEWMKSPELQHLTASEPLTLTEEYEMQKDWLMDEHKCTFIVLDKSIFQSTGDEIAAMIGDTNLFFNDAEWIDVLHVKKYRVKITLDNEASINMFRKMNFHEIERSEIFQEITLENDIAVTDKPWQWILFKRRGISIIDGDYYLSGLTQRWIKVK
ncbi:hypothetical protein KPH14_001999 [Odynerus spinipes]|uniref:Uncharacterized protein n=1 Tax=Odynerus spinipes TaxID=1348599 RepID=A0AAD9S0I5_9HYME|nr:hypothetical protein KPH14_001999 [Odynerus spinipes]